MLDHVRPTPTNNKISCATNMILQIMNDYLNKDQQFSNIHFHGAFN